MKPVPSLPAERLHELKERYNALLRGTGREGAEALIAWLESTDFYTAPASAANHGAITGGLLRHSLSVQTYMLSLVKPIADRHAIADDSVTIVALTHDLCKVNFYSRRTRNVKINGSWVEEEQFTIEDSFPLGHGEKSVFLVQRHLPLTDDEALAIRWHMGGYDDASRQYAGGRTQAAAFDNCKLAAALAIADMYVAQLIGH